MSPLFRRSRSTLPWSPSFKTDPTSPDYDSDQEDDGKWVDENGEEDDGTECDYGILSKVVASSTSS